MIDLSHVVRAYCCREWVVWALSRIGRCGYCADRPRILLADLEAL